MKKALVFAAVAAIFLLSGLWHGANWTYVVWGLYHACLFMPLILLNRNHKYSGFSEDRMFPTLKEVCGMFLTFLLAMLGWIVFRATSLTHAAEYITGLFRFAKETDTGVSFTDSLWLVGVFVGATGILEHALSITAISNNIRALYFFIFFPPNFYNK